MKAVFFHQHGDASKLQYGEIHTPSPAPGEVLVQIKACALNHIDIWVRKGWPGLDLEMPHILGSDISGVVEELGAGVKGIETGQEIVVLPGLSCGRCEWCLKGFDNYCDVYGVIGEHVRGGYAEFVSVPAQNIVNKPENLSFEQAAAYPLTFQTSWHMLVAQAQVQPGDWVLVLAAGSGVGVAAVQIAKLFSANVIAAAGSQAKLDKAKKLGADYLINYEKDGFYQKVREITNGRGVDIVFEHVGKKTWEKSIKSLAKGGRLVTCGATTGFNAITDLRFVFYKNLRIYGNLMGSKGELIRVTQLMAEGKLKPVIYRVLPLEQAKEGHQALMNREQFGKIVLKIKM
ncbi:MAG: zinc-binding dehydrogenase [bacterium]